MSRRKPPERRQRHGESPQLAVIRAGTVTTRVTGVPAPSRDWTPGTVASWRTFWADGLANLCQPVDGSAVRRLFGMIDARDKLWALAMREPLATGSKKQLRAHPAFGMALALDDRIERLGRAFGITPAARAALGITFAEAKKSLEDLAREVQHGVAEAEG